ncbi:MAG: hypothetical protein ABJN42_31640 [Roseibium sp.]|uniref:hypothetical protein n=1 Tax=Roseibium sp. TaxID=1936156 RepID=UPI0032979389
MSRITADTVVTGLEFREFYTHHWPEDWYVEDMPYEAEDEEGNWVLPDDEKRPLDWFGCGYYQGKDPDIKGGIARPMHEIYAEAMKLQSNSTLVSFRVDKDQLEALLAAAEKIGAKRI